MRMRSRKGWYKESERMKRDTKKDRVRMRVKRGDKVRENEGVRRRGCEKEKQKTRSLLLNQFCICYSLDCRLVVFFHSLFNSRVPVIVYK